MYFNQLAKEIGIGQQAILRHMHALENGGLIKTYAEKSDLGAPDRKYYRLNSSFSLTIALSQDSFSIEKSKMTAGSRNKKADTKFYENILESTPSPNVAKNTTGRVLTYLQTDLSNIEREMNDLELRLNELRSLKQLALCRIHELGKRNFGHLERKVLNCVITAAVDSTKSVSQIAAVLNENESNVRNALAGICNRLDNKSAKELFGELK
jgi:ArsR family transcriptional regulator